MVDAGQRTTTSSHTQTQVKKLNKNARLKQIIGILKFLITIDDLVVIKSSIESIIEMMEEDTPK
jgi:hypothetical protein